MKFDEIILFSLEHGIIGTVSAYEMVATLWICLEGRRIYYRHSRFVSILSLHFRSDGKGYHRFIQEIVINNLFQESFPDKVY